MISETDLHLALNELITKQVLEDLVAWGCAKRDNEGGYWWDETCKPLPHPDEHPVYTGAEPQFTEALVQKIQHSMANMS